MNRNRSGRPVEDGGNLDEGDLSLLNAVATLHREQNVTIACRMFSFDLRSELGEGLYRSSGLALWSYVGEMKPVSTGGAHKGLYDVSVPLRQKIRCDWGGL